MRRTRTVAIAFALLALTAGLVSLPASASPLGGAEQAGIDPDRVVLRIDLDPDGTADWRIEYYVRLNDENATAAFESLREDVRANRSAFEERFADRMRRTVRAAENATGREMALRNVTVSTGYSPGGSGILRYDFAWTGFASVEGDRLVAGDAIAGLVLDSSESLLVEWPESYAAVDVTPEADERRPGVTIWRGPRTFASDEPRIVLSTAATPTPTPATGAPGTSPVTGTPTTGSVTGTPTTGTTPAAGKAGGSDDGNPPSGGGVDPALLAGAMVLLALAVLGWLAFTDRLPEGVSDVLGGSPEEAGVSRDEGAETDDGGESEPDDDGPPEELLSNEERVLRLLEDNGGRMKQQAVATELDWTDAKTSQVVGKLRDADEIEVFRIGRENVLALPGESDF